MNASAVAVDPIVAHHFAVTRLWSVLGLLPIPNPASISASANLLPSRLATFQVFDYVRRQYISIKEGRRIGGYGVCGRCHSAQPG